MLIKPSKKRIEFERLLKELGYKDRSPILPQENKKNRIKQTNYICPSGGALAIYSYIVPYFNKKSYLYIEFLNSYGEENLKDKIYKLSQRIIFKEKTRIGEIGWEVIYNQQPSEFSFEERTKIIFDFMKKSFTRLNFGDFNLNPKEGDVLVANPRGVKLNEGFNNSSIELGIRQRSIFGKRFGFGDLYDDGFQYARYNKDLKLKPI